MGDETGASWDCGDKDLQIKTLGVLGVMHKELK
jgi:hypothetical protein